MLKIVHILLFVFLTEISQDILAESSIRCEKLNATGLLQIEYSNNREAGSYAIFYCSVPGNRNGVPFTDCLENGFWRDPPATCTSSCSVPVIENGEIGKTERTTRRDNYEEFQKVFPGEQIVSNQTLLLRCRNGFLPIEDSTFLESNRLEVTCNNSGAWSKVLRCEQTSCTGEPPATKNGRPVINSRKHGYTIWYRCNDRNDIKVRGQNDGVTCHFGKWMGTPPKCLKYPCFTRALNYPGLVKPSQEYLESQESFKIDCEKGFTKATSARKINCNRGQWDISQDPCTDDITCPWFSPGNGLNASYSNENKVESWATFSCAANAKLVGIPYAGCRRDGVWTSSQPYCEDKEKHGAVSTTLSETTSPEECFCTYDYDNHFVKAQIGHKQLKPGDKIMRGETASFVCKFVGRVLSWQNGLRFFGKANMTCSTCKKWQSKDLPTCNYTVRTEAIIGNEDDLKILPGGVVDIRKAERRQFFCSSTWKHPYWDYGERKGVSVNTTQVSEQGNVIFVSLLDIMRTDHEHSGKFECFMEVESGRRIGSSILDLQVDDTVSCSTFPDSPGLKVTYSRNVSVGSIATFSCSTSRRNLIGSSASVCRENGSWSNSLPSCEDFVSCSRFPDSPGLNIRYSRDVSVGSTAKFSCSPSSRNLIGSSISVCRANGSWSNPLPSCEEPKCSVHGLSISVPEDVVPDMTGVNEEFIPSGSVVGLKCNDNSIIVGNSKALCGEHGKWEFGSVQCVPGCTVNIDPSSHLVMSPIKDSYRLGEFLILSCPPGKKLSNDVEILMCMNNKWSDSIPDCQESEESDQP